MFKYCSNNNYNNNKKNEIGVNYIEMAINGLAS